MTNPCNHVRTVCSRRITSKSSALAIDASPVSFSERSHNFRMLMC